jgi:hypothetical protein
MNNNYCQTLKCDYVVKITKINNLDDPVNSVNDDTLSINYTIEGVTDSLPEVGKIFQCLRYRRNDVEVVGFFNTNIVKSVFGDAYDGTINFTTQNSTYKLRILLTFNCTGE